MRIYICGSITNGGTLPREAWPARMMLFKERQEWLEANGHGVLNPCDNVGEPDWQWQDWMRAGIRMLLEAEAISLLPGWEQSRGACLEWEIARSLDYPVVGP